VHREQLQLGEVGDGRALLEGERVGADDAGALRQQVPRRIQARAGRVDPLVQLRTTLEVWPQPVRMKTVSPGCSSTLWAAAVSFRCLAVISNPAGSG
jgi:hypothetical protein